MVYLAYAIMWISTAVASIAGMYFTHSAWCLLVFIVPACIKFQCEESDEEKDEDNCEES